MIQTPRSSQGQGDLAPYVILAALWLVPGVVIVVATVLAGGTPHTRVIDWPYAAIRSVMRANGGVFPWEWVGASTVRSSAVFWGSTILVTVPLLAGVLLGIVVLRGGIPAVFPFLSRSAARSRWAHAPGLARAGLVTARPDGRRLVLGRHGERWIAVGEGVSVLALGAPGSGKSAGLCIPTIGDWEGSVVAVSDRTDLLDATAGLRQYLGRVEVLDALGKPGLATCAWSSTAVQLSFDEAIALVSSVLGSRDPAPDEYTREVLTCVLYAAANRGIGVGSAVEWLDDVTGATLVRSLLLVPDRDHRATSLVRRITERDRNARAASFSAARQLLRAHFEQAAPGAGTRTFQLSEFLAGPAHTLYVLVPAREPPAAAAAPVAGAAPGSAGAPGTGPARSGAGEARAAGDARADEAQAARVLSSLLGTLAAEAEQLPRRRPLLVVLDGCLAVASMQGLAERLAGRSRAVTVLAALRDLDECGAGAGLDMRVLAERAKAVLLLGGGGDACPADLMHHLVRRQLMPRRARALARWDDSRPDLLPPEAARHLGQGRALLVHERAAPAVVWTRNSYEDRELRRRQQEHPFVRGVTRIHEAS